jgi:hypothetical protein
LPPLRPSERHDADKRHQPLNAPTCPTQLPSPLPAPTQICAIARKKVRAIYAPRWFG